MELRQLRSFVAVAEDLHFGRAASRLGLVQPAVSQQLSRLERELGVRLLERTSHRVALTDDGIRVLAEVRAALAAVDRIRDVAGVLARGRANVVRLGTAPGLGRRLLHGLTTLRGMAPDVELVLVDGAGPAHAAAVAAGELDMALVRGPVVAAGVRATQVGADELLAVLPAAHPAAAEPAVQVEALADLRLRLPSAAGDPAFHDAVIARCAEVGFVPGRGRHVVSVEDAALEIAAGADAWTVVVGEQGDPSSCSLAVRPFDPPLCVPVQLLQPATGARRCQDRIADVFR
ncbi:LysR family transcriptional regulator [Pseudonocardia sp. CA-142604]|uniref:LysR family transcriptional regulator n=1 Tax=Pseudonocardia sp. CA-142604 TaxID=3240024 RepID=UPI003D93663F